MNAAALARPSAGIPRVASGIIVRKTSLGSAKFVIATALLTVRSSPKTAAVSCESAVQPMCSKRVERTRSSLAELTASR